MRNGGKGLVWVAILLAAAAAGGFWLLNSGTMTPELAPIGKPSAPAPQGDDALPAPADAGVAGAARVGRERLADPASAAEPTPAVAGATVPTAEYLIGRVVDAQGAPVAGAEVSYGGSLLPAFARGRAGRGPGGRGRNGRGRFGGAFANTVTEVAMVKAKSGADGAFRLDRPPRSEGIELRVDHPDYVMLTRNDLVLPASGLDVGTLKLETGGTVAGFIYGPGGAKLAGADVMLIDPPNEEGGRGFFNFNFGARGERHATTDEEGRFRLTGMPVGKAVVEASATGLVTGTSEVFEVVAAQVAGEVVLHLERGFTLAGTVKGPDGKPVAGAEITVVDPNNWMRMVRSGGEPDWVTGDDGRYEISGLKAGAQTVTATAAGFARKETPNIDPAQVGTLDITLGATLFVAGRVTLKGTSETPSDVKVQLVPNWGGGGEAFSGMAFFDSPDAENKTTENGAFRIEGVEPGDYRIVARAAGTTRGQSEPFKIEEGKNVENLLVEVERGASLAGRILDPSGAPVANATIRLVEPRQPPQNGGNEFAVGATIVAGGRGGFRPRFANFDGRRTLGRTTSGPDGSYVVDHLGPGSFEVELSHADFAMTLAEVKELAAVEQRKNIDFRITRGGTLEGTIVGLDGAPRAGDRINVTSKSVPAASLSAVSDANGNYRLDHIPAGEATASREEAAADGNRGPAEMFIVMAGGGGKEEGKAVVIEEGQTLRVDFSQQEKPVLEGIVTCADGPVAGATVTAAPDNGGGGRGFPGMFGQRKEATTGADGRYRMTDLDVGNWRVSVRHPQGLVPTTATVALAAGAPMRQDFTLEGGVIDGRTLLAGTKDGIEGAVVQLERVNEGDGAEGGGANGLARVDLAFTTVAAGGPIGGRGRTFRFGGGDAAETRVSTSRDGSFRIPWVPAGKYRIRVTHPGHLQSTSEVVELATDAHVSDVKVELPLAARLKVHVRNKATGQPVADTAVQLSFESEGRDFGMTDSDGIASFDSLKPGSWTVTLRNFNGPGGRGRGGNGGGDEPSTTVTCEAGLTAETTIDQ